MMLAKLCSRQIKRKILSLNTYVVVRPHDCGPIIGVLEDICCMPAHEEYLSYMCPCGDKVLINSK
jgi:hypothetical protein